MLIILEKMASTKYKLSHKVNREDLNAADVRRMWSSLGIAKE